MPIFNSVYKAIEKWKPGANTIAYYPFTEDRNDHSGNGYNVTDAGISTLTTVDGVKCLFPNNQKVVVGNIDSLNGYSSWTISFRCKITGRFAVNFKDNGSWGGGGIQMWKNSSGQIEIRYGNPTNQYTQTTVGLSLNTWMHIVLTVYDGYCYVYRNNNPYTIRSSGTVAPSTNATLLNIGGDYYGDLTGDGNGYISNLIIEKQGWTPGTVENYYNLTKGDYGY